MIHKIKIIISVVLVSVFISLAFQTNFFTENIPRNIWSGVGLLFCLRYVIYPMLIDWIKDVKNDVEEFRK